ncbi:hypothetical protein SAMN02745673_02447 [Marinactinospora thermotolerans DSM 45154]|uniref:Uncharacterized protein n=1 Tax=Marinactinospora thermotolerans DSM 45154 TaxID=1122192 RepID=A0A1T4R387_9ACTN|nr:hypothetical protein [Marinactinospora thermotolerans]SKA10088.1 hypothetical protein SAMN02745673_02447 [Marinactinospora thermotolerans DSM 45154]
MTDVKVRAYALVRTLFKIALIICFALGTLLVLGQVAGVIVQRPGWVTGASDLFFVPTVTAAAAFGVLGFVGGYLAPGTTEDDS